MTAGSATSRIRRTSSTSRFHSRTIADENSNNDSFYANPELDALLDAARARARSGEARARCTSRAERILYDDAPWIWDYHRDDDRGRRSRTCAATRRTRSGSATTRTPGSISTRTESGCSDDPASCCAASAGRCVVVWFVVTADVRDDDRDPGRSGEARCSARTRRPRRSSACARTTASTRASSASTAATSTHVAHGDLGESYRSKRPVDDDHRAIGSGRPRSSRSPRSCCSCSSACRSASSPRCAADAGPITRRTSSALLGQSAPTFFVGTLLLYVFAYRFGWFPIGGYGSGVLDRLHHLVLPGGDARHGRHRVLRAGRAQRARRRARRGLRAHRAREGPARARRRAAPRAAQRARSARHARRPRPRRAARRRGRHRVHLRVARPRPRGAAGDPRGRHPADPRRRARLGDRDRDREPARRPRLPVARPAAARRRDGPQSARHARFVILLGWVSLFADLCYEGMRSAIGPYLAFLGASATAVGVGRRHRRDDRLRAALLERRARRSHAARTGRSRSPATRRTSSRCRCSRSPAAGRWSPRSSRSSGSARRSARRRRRR